MARLASLSGALREADLDREVRVIVLTGAGRGFCAGLDLKDTAAGTGIGGDGANLALARLGPAGRPPRGAPPGAGGAGGGGPGTRGGEPGGPGPATKELAAEIAANAPLAVQATKRM